MIMAKRPAGAYTGKRDRAKHRAFQQMLGELPDHVRHMYDSAKCGKKTDIINTLMQRDSPSSEWQLALNAPMFEERAFDIYVYVRGCKRNVMCCHCIHTTYRWFLFVCCHVTSRRVSNCDSMHDDRINVAFFTPCVDTSYVDQYSYIHEHIY